MRNAFVDLATVQRTQRTLFCAGLDIHPFGNLKKNLDVYHGIVSELTGEAEVVDLSELYSPFSPIGDDFILLLSSITVYLEKVIDILFEKCGIRVFKLQAGLFEQFGPAGMMMMQEILQYIRDLEADHNSRVIVIGDVKRGDIASTQTGYLTAYLGNLRKDWGIDHQPFGFDIVNVSPWMGEDVLVLGTPENPGLGLELMRSGKGIIIVNQTSNPSGYQYQGLVAHLPSQPLDEKLVRMWNVAQMNYLSAQYELEQSGLSAIGLVVGSTNPCDGSIRKEFPTTTMLAPGFGAQGGKFCNIMPELIRNGEWNGQGAIFSSSRAVMFPWMKEFGGSGEVKNLETDLMQAVTKFRDNERTAFSVPAVLEMGINYPFN